MNYSELQDMIDKCDKLLDYMEALSEDKFLTLHHFYNTTYDMRECLRQQEIEYHRIQLEKTFTLS